MRNRIQLCFTIVTLGRSGWTRVKAVSIIYLIQSCLAFDLNGKAIREIVSTVRTALEMLYN